MYSSSYHIVLLFLTQMRHLKMTVSHTIFEISFFKILAISKPTHNVKLIFYISLYNDLYLYLFSIIVATINNVVTCFIIPYNN